MVNINNIKDKKILVIGGAGFIGSHLCEWLVKGNTIISLDDYSTGSKENHLFGVEYIHGHSRDIFTHIKFRPDIIFHLGEYSRVEQSFEDIDLVHESNVNGTYKVIKFALMNKSRLVYAGSSTKYSKDIIGRNQSPYGWSKANNTDLVVNFGNWFGLDYVITYFYNAYGPREIADGKYSTVVAKFLKQYKENKKLTIVSPGTQKRNFTHVFDIVNGLIITAHKGRGDGYGIGSDEKLSINDLAALFNCDIQYLPERNGNRLDADLVTDKTKQLGWEAKFSIYDYVPNQINKK